MWGWLVGVAQATPFASTVPVDPMDRHDTELGAGIGTWLVPDAPTVVPLISGWARWGATDRIELSGGAWMPLNPVDVGVHGLARAQLLGRTDGGAALAAGLGAGLYLNSGVLALAAPVQAGWTGPTGGVWIGASPALYPLADRVLATVGLEAGGAIEVGVVPVYVQGLAELGDLFIVGAIVGVGVPLEW